MAVATEMGVEFEEIRYTKNPPDEAALRDMIAKLEDPVEHVVGGQLVRVDLVGRELGRGWLVDGVHRDALAVPVRVSGQR